MVCMLIDDWLYMDVDGNVGVYGRQEIDRSFKSKFKSVKVSFLDYQTKTLPLVEQRSSYQEALINSAFDDSFMITQERLSASLVQVIGAKKDCIENIYQQLSNVAIESFVPYGAAVRAFLKSKGLIDSTKCIIFLDDLRNQTLLTIFEGGAFSSPRRINMRDDSYMVSEIKRSWQNFLLERANTNKSSDISFTLVSNNQEWLSAFAQQGFLLRQDMVHIPVNFIVLEGLKTAKFATHFEPAKEVLKKKKTLLWKNRLKVFLMSFFLILLGVGIYSAVSIYEQKEKKRYEYLKQRSGAIKTELRDLYQKKFLSILSERTPVAYSRVYYDFIQSIPAGYLIESSSFENKDDQNLFQGDIYPENEYTVQDKFRCRLSFMNAKVFSGIFNKSLGQRITLKIGSEGNEL